MRRPAVVGSSLVAVIAALDGLVVVVVGRRASRWARDEAMPADQPTRPIWPTSMALSDWRSEALAVLPDDVQLSSLVRRHHAAGITTDPPGADRSVRRRYHERDETWHPLGRTPLENVRLPFGLLRFQISKDGYESR